MRLRRNWGEATAHRPIRPNPGRTLRVPSAEYCVTCRLYPAVADRIHTRWSVAPILKAKVKKPASAKWRLNHQCLFAYRPPTPRIARTVERYQRDIQRCGHM